MQEQALAGGAASADPSRARPPGPTADAPSTSLIASGARVIAAEAVALDALTQWIGEPFAAAVRVLAAVEGRIVVTGMGKSGHVGCKIASTLASTGSPAMFVHPAEASHGDLGMITRADAVLALSNSGETSELRDLTLYSRRFGIPLVAIVGRPGSTLGEEADVALVLPSVGEACPMGLAPTTSTTCMLALGDALAVALLDLRGFSAHEFAVFHPGGKLGSQLLRVEQLMRGRADVPLARLDAPMTAVVVEMTRGCIGCVAVVDTAGRLEGVITDGDLRRHMTGDLLARTASEVMSPRPRTIDKRALAVEALAMMNDPARPITALFIVEDGRPIGALHVHDCLRAGIA